MLDWLLGVGAGPAKGRDGARGGAGSSPRKGREAPAPLLVTVGEQRLPLTIRRLPRARRMTLRLSPDGSEVRVSMPRWGHSAEALAFARARADWLAGQLARVAPRQSIGPGAALPYRGTPLEIAHDPAHPRRPRAGDGMLRIGGPAEGLDTRLRRWLMAEAKVLLADDLAHYATLAGQALPKLALSNARARWGSCSSTGIVRINWRLVLAPDRVRRSVVAHEVAHLIHFDHSADFHALLARLFEGDIAEANGWLKREGRGLYAWFG